MCSDQFTQGYLCAVANLLQSHGDSQEVTDLLQGIGDLSQAKIDEHDEAIFIEHGYLEARQ